MIGVTPSRRAVLLLGARVLGVAAVVGSVYSCGGSPDVDFTRRESVSREVVASGAPSTTALRIAVAPVLSARPTSSLYGEFAGYLSRELGRPVELVLGKTYAEINDLVKAGDVDVAVVCTAPFVAGNEEFGMELLVVPQVHGQRVYYSLLIAGERFDGRSLRDLRGASFAFSDPMSNSGRLVPVYQLALMGESPDTFFSRTIFTYSHDSSIQAVAHGVVTAAAVDSLVFDYIAATSPELVGKVRVLERWGPFGINPVVTHPRLDPGLKADVRQVLLDMDANPEGRRILARLMIDRFVLGDESAYDSVREMLRFMRNRGLGP